MNEIGFLKRQNVHVRRMLSRNLSLPVRCMLCGMAESPAMVILPRAAAHRAADAWLHAECWPAWYRARQLKATAALRAFGLKPTAETESLSKADSHQNSAEAEP